MSGVCDMLEVYCIGRSLKRNFCFAVFGVCWFATLATIHCMLEVFS